MSKVLDSNHQHPHQLPKGQSPPRNPFFRFYKRENDYTQKDCLEEHQQHEAWKVIDISENCVQILIFMT